MNRLMDRWTDGQSRSIISNQSNQCVALVTPMVRGAQLCGLSRAGVYEAFSFSVPFSFFLSFFLYSFLCSSYRKGERN